MFRAPRQLPPLEFLLRDIGQPAPAVIARALGVTERTVYGWISKGEAPRPAALALFWETSYGRSEIECNAVNGERYARALVSGLERQKATLQARVAYLESVGTFGSANAPLFLSEAPAFVARR
jgi:hypothetical protein